MGWIPLAFLPPPHLNTCWQYSISDWCSLLLFSWSSCNYITKQNAWQSTSVWQKYCAQWQLNITRCLTHNLCAISIGFTQCDNCTIALYSNTIKAWVPSCSRFWVHCTTDHSFPMQTQKITEITENKQKFTADLWCEQTRLHKLPKCTGINTTTQLGWNVTFHSWIRLKLLRYVSPWSTTFGIWCASLLGYSQTFLYSLLHAATFQPSIGFSILHSIGEQCAVSCA